MRLDLADHDVPAVALGPVGCVEHRLRLADANRVAEEDSLQAPRALPISLPEAVQHGVRIWPLLMHGSSLTGPRRGPG